MRGYDSGRAVEIGCYDAGGSNRLVGIRTQYHTSSSKLLVRCGGTVFVRSLSKRAA